MIAGLLPAASSFSAVSALLVVGALLFGVVSGANDGGTLVSLATRTAVMPPGLALALLASIVALGPLILGAGVATTVAHRLVAFDGAGGHLALVAAVGAALLIVVVLGRRGLSTSLTLALMGGIAGAGLGEGLPVSWATLGVVLAIGLLAPLASVFVAWTVTRGVASLPATWWVGARGRALQRAGFLVQSVAYSSNDAQKMVAILAIGTQSATSRVEPHWGTQLLLGACFAAGTAIGVRPLAGRVAERVSRVRPANAVVLELSSSAVVLASSALGAPVSSTQAATAALLGTGIAGSSQRVRWREVGSIGLAWALTLPTSFATGYLLGLLLRVTR